MEGNSERSLKKKETLNKLKSTLKKSKDFRENVLCKD